MIPSSKAALFFLLLQSIRHCSVVSSAPTILRPWVRIPSTPSTYAFFSLNCWNWNCICWNEKRMKINEKEAGIGRYFKNIFFIDIAGPPICILPNPFFFWVRIRKVIKHSYESPYYCNLWLNRLDRFTYTNGITCSIPVNKIIGHQLDSNLDRCSRWKHGDH